MNDQTTIDDALQFERLRNDDHQAFEYLFRKYYAAVCAYASRFVGETDAEDVADHCMMWLWEKRHGIEIQTSFRQYLFTIAYHRSIKIATDRRISDQTAGYLESYLKRNESGPDQNDFITGEELRRRIQTSLDSMPETYRDAFVLHRFEGKSYKEIAEIYGMSVKTIDYRIQQALKKLKKDLSDYLPAILLTIAMCYLEGTTDDLSPRSEQSWRNCTVLSTEV